MVEAKRAAPREGDPLQNLTSERSSSKTPNAPQALLRDIVWNTANGCHG
jgi:hypothetical protein